MRQREKGITLPELVIALVAIALVLATASSGLADMVKRNALVARANNVVGLIHRAREHAVMRDPVLVCLAPGGCRESRNGTGLVAVVDRNHNGVMDGPGELLEVLAFGDGMQVAWRSFRGKPWLRFGRRGTAYYQNGHFLLCYRGDAAKVIVTRIGRPRVEMLGERSDLCSPA